MSEVNLRAATLADAEGIAKVRVDSWRATYRGIIPDADLDGMDVEESKALWERILAAGSVAATVFVAERDSEIIGFAAGKTLEEKKYELDAELAAIYLRPAAQRARIGRLLLRMVAEAYRDKDAHGMIVWVLADNQIARQFYEDLGAELLVEQPFPWNDDLELVEVGYGWRDLSALVEACGE